jgi:phenylacetaldehyde dehydrogenase
MTIAPPDQLQIAELVDGVIGQPSDELDGWLTDPDTGARLHRQRQTSGQTLDVAVDAAARFHDADAWMGRAAAERAELLRAFGEQLAARSEELARADSIDSGVPLDTTRLLAFVGAQALVAAAGLVASEHERTVLAGMGGDAEQWRLPWGPAAVMVPWNAPAPTALFKTAAALAAGCPVIMKPSEWAPHFAAPVAEAARASGLPGEMLQVVQGGPAIGHALAADARVQAVSYTGGVVGGRAVAAACAERFAPADLELSGNNPVVILPDAGVDAAVEAIVTGLLFLNGQWCAGPRRIVVPETMRDALIDALLTRLGNVVIGPSTESSTQLGPMAHAGHLAHLQRRLAMCAEEGHTVQAAGAVPDGGGHFLAPAVVTGPKARSLRDEMFGPIVVVLGYADLEEAVEIANDHVFGLSAYVLGPDEGQARRLGRRLRAGRVVINRVDVMPSAEDGVSNMWGQSGMGAIGGLDGVRFFTGARLIGF